MLNILVHIILNKFAFVNPFLTNYLNFFVKYLLTFSKQICYNTRKMFRQVICVKKCICHHIPKDGNFKIGKEYSFQYGIDCICVTDDNGQQVFFDEITFLWYFTK